MKTTLKRVLSMALALVLLVGALPMAAQAYTHTVGTHQFEIDATGHECMTEGCGEAFHDRKMDHNDTLFNSPADGVCAVCEYPCMNGHNMSDATCTVPETCAGCGKTVGTVDGHNWNDATCTAPKTCADCGETEGTTAAHNFGNNEPVCQSCGAENPDYEEPEVIPAVLVIWENGIEKYRADGTPNSNVSIADCLACGEINGDHVTKIAINGTEVETSVNGSFVLGAAGTTTTINFTTVVPNPGTGSGSDAGNSSGSGTTTTPNKYNVYYNVNVDEDSKVNKPFGTYEEGTRLSTIVQTLKAMEGSTIKFPGLFETWFAVEGWYVDGIKVTDVDTRILTGNTVFYAKWYQKYNYEVVLKLYTNGNTNTVVKVIDAFKYVQDDGKLSHTEVTNIAKEYIEPNNNAGLTVYGPFQSGQQWDNYCQYPNRLTNTEYVEVNKYGTTIVHAMVHNAKIYNSTSSTGKKADSTNPKTGDMIMMPVAVMGTSVTALAVMFYLKKKRTV